MDQKGNAIFVEKPKLRQPYMVCGISGRVDGGGDHQGTPLAKEPVLLLGQP